MTAPNSKKPTPVEGHAQAGTEDQQWDLVIRSAFLRRLAFGCVAIVMAVHIFMAIVVAVGDTGVAVTGVDQISFIGIGLVFAGVSLLLLRPRVRVNAQGVEVRNIANAQFYPWDLVYGLSFPASSKMARLELPDFEFVPMMAMNIYDKKTIALEVERFRRLEDIHMPEE